jgi:hypothetical protein
MLPSSIEALPIAGQLVVFAIGGFGYAVAIAIAYLRGLPKKPEESKLSIVGALISGDDADRIIGAIHSNSRAIERLEKAVDRATDETQRLCDHMISDRRR